MNKALFNRRVRKLHLWFGLAIGAQIGLWLISGLFMTWFSIDTVRGNHLKSNPQVQQVTGVSALLPLQAVLSKADFQAETLLLKRLNGRNIWIIGSGRERMAIDAVSGDIVSPLPVDMAEAIALAHYSGSGAIFESKLYSDPPSEYGRAGPVWRVDFKKPEAASFYVDAVTGEVKAVRTPLWRVFDFMWGLHIMDWKTRENFNSWWIKMTALLAFVFFISGVVLACLRLIGMVSRRRRLRPKH